MSFKKRAMLASLGRKAREGMRRYFSFVPLSRGRSSLSWRKLTMVRTPNFSRFWNPSAVGWLPRQRAASTLAKLITPGTQSSQGRSPGGCETATAGGGTWVQPPFRSRNPRQRLRTTDMRPPDQDRSARWASFRAARGRLSRIRRPRVSPSSHASGPVASTRWVSLVPRLQGSRR